MSIDPDFTFPPEADFLRQAVQDLGSYTINVIARGTAALMAGDHVTALQIVVDDDEADALYHSIEDGCLALLEQAGAEPRLLRTIVAAQRIAYELERSADLMVNVAKSTRRLRPTMLNPVVEVLFQRMGRQAGEQTAAALDAFARADAGAAQALDRMDDTMDDLTNELFRSILTDTARDLDEGTLQWAVQVALIGRHYERIADHAVTIGERVQFMVTGVHPDRPDAVDLR